MKHSIILSASFSMLALAAGLTSCEFEQEDFFDEPAALRIESTNADIKAKLVAGSSNGWLMQYFVAGTDEMTFEGFNLFGKFYETGKVTLSGNHRFLRNGNAGKYTEYTSYYEMLKEEGSVLAFNTWNDILTVFVDPVSPSYAPNNVVNDGEGMHGDDRLVMQSYSDDYMEFRGERHGAKVYFSKFDRSPEQYMADIESLKSAVAGDFLTEYSLTNGDTTVYISGLNKGYFNILDRLDDPLQSSTYSCVFTPDGFRMQFPYDLKGDSVQIFKLNSDKTALVCGNATLKPEWVRPVKVALTTNDKALITQDGACDQFVQLYQALADGVKENYSSQNFAGISFGSSNESLSNRRTGIIFNMKASRNTYQVAYTTQITVDGPDAVTLAVDLNDPSANYATYSKRGLGPLFDALAQALSGTYKLEADQPFNPTKITWKKTNDPNFYFQMELIRPTNSNNNIK